MQQNPLFIRLESFMNNQTSNPKIFGASIFDFVKEYDTKAILQQVDKNLQKDEHNDATPSREYQETASYEMELAYYEYRDYQLFKDRQFALAKYRRLNAIHSLFRDASLPIYTSQNNTLFNVYSFEAYRNPSMAVINDLMRGKYLALRDFVWDLVHDDTEWAKKLLKQSAILDDEERIQECVFAPSFYLWRDKQEGFENIQPSRVWHSRNELVDFYTNYEQKQYSLKGEDIEEFRLHMQRVLHYTIDFLQSSAPVNNEDQQYKISYEHGSGKFTINGDQTEFKTNFSSHIVLKTLISSTGPIKKKAVEFEVILSKILKTHDHAKSDPNIYEVCRSINKSLAKLGYPKFLLIKDDTVKINPKYLY